jgi:hypothetical protein
MERSENLTMYYYYGLIEELPTAGVVALVLALPRRIFLRR